MVGNGVNRLKSTTVAAEVAEALDLFPESLQRYLKFDVFEGDPVFSGVGPYLSSYLSKATNGRSLRTTAHVCYPWHTYDERTTVVIPELIGVAETVHELAHVLDFALDFSIGVWPVTWYAKWNRAEAFAEFVTAALVPGYLEHDRRGQEYVAPQRWALAALEAA